MDNLGWIKLYRKILNNDLIKDGVALQIFIWLLLKVDKKSGKRTIGRFQVSDELGLNSNTFYKALKRLEKKWQVVTLSSNNRFTEVLISNWAKYQDKSEDGNTSGNSSVTTGEQQSNTKQEYKNKELRNKNIIAESSAIPVKIKKYERLPLEKQLPLHRVCYYLEDTLRTEIVNWGKQAKALSMMLKSGYTEEQIKKAILYMATKDDFFSDKGFDLMTVANQMPRYKAEAMASKRKPEYVHN